LTGRLDCSAGVQALLLKLVLSVQNEHRPNGLQEMTMKRFLLAASAVLLAAAPALALAQEEHHDGGRPENRSQSAPPAPPRPAGPPPARPQGAPQGAPQGGGAPAYRPQGAGVPNGPGGQGYRPNGAQPGYRPGATPGAPGGQPGRGFAPQGGGQPPRNYPQAVRPRAGALAFNYSGRQYYRYRAAPYAYPQGYYGWSNHAWRIGEWLPPVFISEGYYINDWYDFGLYQPYYGYQWVRVGADAVLVNLATGAVVDVVPGVYYW
jgi:Ni/Co efflux regulator RcnB